MDSGMPSSNASDAASEKLSTVMIDITVDAKERFRAFKTSLIELSSEDCNVGVHRLTKSIGTEVRATKSAADST